MPERSDVPAASAARDRGRLVVRAARRSDFEAVAALSAMPGLRHGTLRLPHRKPEETRRFLGGLGPDHLQLVAGRGAAVLGTGGWTRFKGRRSRVAGIGMGVHDDRAGRGIGTAQTAARVGAADRWYGLRRLTLGAHTDDARAIGLCRRFGFEDEGVARGDAFRDGRFAGDLRIEWPGPAV